MTRFQRVVAGGVLGLLVVASLVLLANDRDAPAFVVVPSAAEATIAVHVDGAVATPGVVLLPVGARLADAIDAAGGLDPAADVSQLNLAGRLADAQRLDIPRASVSPTAVRVDGQPSPDQARSAADQPTQAAGRINLNTASAGELETLPGIGPVLAERIVAHREQHGPFRSVEDLDAVAGISARLVEELRPLVTVDG